VLADSVVVAGRVLEELRRNRRLLFFWVVFPTLMLLLFGWVYADGYGGLGPSFSATAPGILIGAAMFFSCLSGPVALIVGGRERRTLRRLMASPLSGKSYFLGVVWAHLGIAAGQVALVYGITYGVGGSFQGSIMLGVVIVALSAVAYVGLGFVFGARLARRTEDVTGLVAAVGVPLLVLGGTFFTTDMLPPFLYAVAQLDPIFHMNEAFRGAAHGDIPVADMAGSLVFLALFAPVSLVLGARSYASMLDRERTS